MHLIQLGWASAASPHSSPHCVCKRLCFLIPDLFCVLVSAGALHSMLGAMDNRVSEEASGGCFIGRWPLIPPDRSDGPRLFTSPHTFLFLFLLHLFTQEKLTLFMNISLPFIIRLHWARRPCIASLASCLMFLSAGDEGVMHAFPVLSWSLRLPAGSL